MVAQVIVDVVHTNVARPFSYLVPEGAEVSVGARVSVPLGRRRVDGIVVELLDNPPDGLPPEKLRPIGAPPRNSLTAMATKNGAVEMITLQLAE